MHFATARRSGTTALLCVVAVVGSAALAGCAPEERLDQQPGPMPALRGHSLSYADGALDRAFAEQVMIRYRAAASNDTGRWVVCEQSPRPGRPAMDVRLVVADECGG